MSRTYHHGDRAKRRLYPDFLYTGAYPVEPTPPKRRRTSVAWRWMRTPASWHRLMHTRPWRRRVAAEILREMSLISQEDCRMPPHATRVPGAYRRPHIYYW